MLRKLSKVTQRLRGQDAAYSEEVKTHVEQGKLVKQKVLDDLQEKLAAHNKAQLAVSAQHKTLAAAFAAYAETLKESEPALAAHFAESAEWLTQLADMQDAWSHAGAEWVTETKAFVDQDYANVKKVCALRCCVCVRVRRRRAPVRQWWRWAREKFSIILITHQLTNPFFFF